MRHSSKLFKSYVTFVSRIAQIGTRFSKVALWSKWGNLLVMGTLNHIHIKLQQAQYVITEIKLDFIYESCSERQISELYCPPIF